MNFSVASGREWLRETGRDALSAQAGRLILWIPVALGGGCAVYLSLKVEPALWMALGLVAVCGALVWGLRRFSSWPYVANIAWLFLAFSVGFTVCKARTERVAAPVLSSVETQFRIEAVVIDIIGSDTDKPRLLVAPLRMSGLSPEGTPIRLRLSLRQMPEGLAPGQAIRTFAIVNPPAAPNIPGGFDYARTAWFDAIGGVGFVPGKVVQIATPPMPGRLKRMVTLNAWRWQITRHIVGVLDGQAGQGTRLGGFAAALVTGHQAYLAPQLVEDMRDSGLAHILSISGLHMAIVGGFAFFASRAGLALIPAVALRYPIKKWAAGFGIFAVIVYLAISGAPAPAIRAAVVAIVAFGAILLDRRALSLRALALAAIVVLCLMPEAVFEPGFQMSFCATAALLALSESLPSVPKELSVPWWVRAWQGFWRGIWVSIVASTVAGLATTPFGIFYFNRAQMYGLIANLLEAPITGFVIMPALAVGTALSATPLGTPFLWLAGWGLSLIDRIAGFVAHLPGAVAAVSSPPDIALLLSFGGVLWLCLIRGKARWFGMIAALAILYWPREKAPDLWLHAEGANAAFQIDGKAYALRPKVQQYGYEQWVKRYSLTPDEARLAQDYQCKSYVCVPTGTAPYSVGFAFGKKPPKVENLEALCRSAKLVVLRSEIDTWPDACIGVNRITAADFKRLRAMELNRNPNGTWSIKAAQPLRGHRPWSR
ncbi:ComEC/Rec2 family competence protein [Asticcacaulis sp. BYS171W]|uniref:ComEC/Rec2 family competence protein n=1 Tax=Asticcacaulis aquaticus TaxID=2984212 RepID=A0ABT5HQX7_9CAUL|nr:ComEC/Rec2 family competence protein [Asticcacaulis aquaticus]